jgi:uncharacterized membrane protein YphA (DoxX/SURF4 family)
VFLGRASWRAISTVAGAAVALVFIAAGLFKVANVGPLAEAFAKAGYPEWVRATTGIVEILGGVVLLRPRYTVYAPVVFAVAVVTAVLVHQASGAESVQAGVPFVMTIPLSILGLAVWRNAADSQRWHAMLDDFAERELSVARGRSYSRAR